VQPHPAAAAAAASSSSIHSITQLQVVVFAQRDAGTTSFITLLLLLL
jgi:hypothetical protein